MKCRFYQLEDFDISQLQLIKEQIQWYGDQDHSRWVFRSQGRGVRTDQRDLFIKIWNPSYLRRDNILKGLDVGFYTEETTPALVGLILHKEKCRGYVMKRCKRNWKLELDERFYSLVKKTSTETGYFNYQFSPYHLMRYEGTYSMVDLEGLYPIRELPRMADYHCHFDFKDYEEFIAELYVDRFKPGGESLRGVHDPGTPQFRKRPFLVRSASFFRSKVVTFLGKKKKTHIHLLEK